MEHLPIYPAFEKSNLAITMQTSDFFAPYASVTALSIIEHTSPAYNYDIIFMTWDMKEETERRLVSMAEGRENVSIRVVDVSEEIKPQQNLAKEREDYDRFSATGVVRLLMPELLQNYDVVLNFDCDMLICADVAELFQYDLTDFYYGAVQDIVYYTIIRINEEQRSYITDKVFNKLGLSSLSEYLNAGLLLLNIGKIRQDYSEKEILDFAIDGDNYFLCYEQDTFNGLFKMNKLKLPIEWNWHVDGASLISIAANKLPPCDPAVEEYRCAEENVKNYHYLTTRKPWNNAAMPYAGIWWEAAEKCPFIDVLLSRINTANIRDRLEGNRYLLFACETAVQLINAINIKTHYYPNTPADLILFSSVDLRKYSDNIATLHLFDKIIFSDYNAKQDYDLIMEMPTEKRSLHPEKYSKMISLREHYTDYFLPVPEGVFQKMIYYSLVKRDLRPVVHIFEEGLATYTENLTLKLTNQIDHTLYPLKKRITENVLDIFLYKPELYCGKADVPILPIPAIKKEGQFAEWLYYIFGDDTIPDERYIFFNEDFSSSKRVSNDLQLLDAIADVVGRDNIAVKMHPLSSKGEALYRTHGYHTYANDSLPWELYALKPGLENKVLLSVSSNALFVPFTIADKKIYLVSLLDVMRLSRRPHANTAEYRRFLDKFANAVNQDDRIFFSPRNLTELEKIICYLERSL